MLSGQTRTGIKAPRAIAAPSPTTAKGPRAGLAISLMLHAGLVAATWLTWRHMSQFEQESHAVPVELVVAEQTNVRAEAPPQPPPKVEIPKPAVPVPPEPQMAEAEPAPEPPVPQFKIVRPKTVTEQPPDEQPKPKTPPTQDFAALLNKLTAQPKVPKNAKAGPRVIEGAGNQSAATADLADALKSQIYRCWNPPMGAPDANDLVVDFDLTLNPDGTVAGRPQLSTRSALAMGNPYTRAAAEAAMRAIYQCAPYRLPPARYNQWREISPLRFDPREMMGQ